MKLNLVFSLLFISAAVSIISGCGKDPIDVDNPYDSIDYGNTTPPADTVGAATLVGLHRNLLFPRCAVPGCHDGNFEPDFRTVQSSYSTLIYSPVTKNNASASFKYRVVPFKKAESVLFERITNCCFVNQDDRMPQDNIGTALPQKDIDNVGEWIDNGAKDINGNVPEQPDLEPIFQLYVAANSTFTVEFSNVNNRIDSVIYNSFKLPAGTPFFYMAVSVSDDQTPLDQLQYNKLYISTSMDNFSGAIQVAANFIVDTDFNTPGNQSVWLLNVPSQNFTPGQTYYMRYYVNDGKHAENTEFPKNSSIDYYKTYWSFIVVP
jgi:hypothetical protein